MIARLPTFGRRAGATIALLLLAGATPSIGSEDIAARLAAVADQSTTDLTTSGRRTGKPHTVPVWFVVDGKTIYLNTLDVKRDWPQNISKNPRVKLRIGELELTGRATRVTDEAQFHHAVDLLREKYFAARVGGWVGKRPEAAFRIDDLQVAGQPPPNQP